MQNDQYSVNTQILRLKSLFFFRTANSPAGPEAFRKVHRKYANMVLETSGKLRGSRNWSRNIFWRSGTPGKAPGVNLPAPVAQPPEPAAEPAAHPGGPAAGKATDPAAYPGGPAAGQAADGPAARPPDGPPRPGGPAAGRAADPAAVPAVHPAARPPGRPPGRRPGRRKQSVLRL